MSMRRVVITGLGVVSGIGNDLETFWDSLISGKSGVGTITKFDITNYPVKIASEVLDLDMSPWLEKHELRKYDPYCIYAIAAAEQSQNNAIQRRRAASSSEG